VQDPRPCRASPLSQEGAVGLIRDRSRLEVVDTTQLLLKVGISVRASEPLSLPRCAPCAGLPLACGSSNPSCSAMHAHVSFGNSAQSIPDAEKS